MLAITGRMNLPEICDEIVCNGDAGDLLAQLPCYEVDGFGDCRHDPARAPTHKIRYWPFLWGVALFDDTLRDFYLYAAFATREEAQDEARRISLNLHRDQGECRRTLPTRIGFDVPQDFASQHPNLEALFEFGAAGECTLFGPHTNAGLASLPQANKADQLIQDIVKFQNWVAMEYLLLTARGLRRLSVDVRQRVYSFAYTSQAWAEPRRDPTASGYSSLMAFTLSSSPKTIPPFYGSWTAHASCHATVNDVVRLVHAKLWEISTNEDHAEWFYDDDILLMTEVSLIDVPGLEFRRGMPPYIRQACKFQQYVSRLAIRDGLPHVRAIAFSH